MKNKSDNSSFSEADKATALSALASAKTTDPGQCPGPEQLACLVDGKIEAAEKDKLLKHLGNCRHCYELWLSMSQISQVSSQKKVISGPWKKIIRIGSPILAVAASVAIFVNVFSPSYSISPIQNQDTTFTVDNAAQKADMELMDEVQQEAIPQLQKHQAKPAEKKERSPRQSFSKAERKMAPVPETRSLLGAAPSARPQPQIFVYTCNDYFEFVCSIEGENAWLFLPGNTVKTSHVPSASGDKYIKDSIVFWSKDEEALLEIADSPQYKCSNDRSKAIWEQAKFDGIDFRAVGNEPGWELTIIYSEKVVFTTNYGHNKYSWATPEMHTDQQKQQTTFTAEGGGNTMEVLLTISPCQDSMADISYETRVHITLNGKQYLGCGKALH